jgi:hypothetical protein
MTLDVPNKKQVAHRVDSATVSNPHRSPCTLSAEAAGAASFAGASMPCGGLAPMT